MSRQIVLGQAFDGLADKDACLVEFAQTLTARPWTVGPADIQRLFAAGFSRPQTALVIGLVAVFNYLTRVADGTGIEADYGGELPEFVYRDGTESVPRPERHEWPAVDRSLGLLSLVADDAEERWDRWREYLTDSTEPVPVATRRRIRAIAARAACDAVVAPAGSDDDTWSAGDSGRALSEFAEKLSLTPWLMRQADVDSLRATGMDDVAVLHVISLVAYQSAESRLRIGLSALARCAD